MGKEEEGCASGVAKKGGFEAGLMPLGSRRWDGRVEGGRELRCPIKAWVPCKRKEIKGESGSHNWFGVASLE